MQRFFRRAKMTKQEKERDDLQEKLSVAETNAVKYSDNLTAFIELGNAKAALGRHADAIKDFTIVIERDKVGYDALVAYALRGLAKLNLKQYNEAIADYELYFNPPLKTVHRAGTLEFYYLGLAKECVGRIEEAEKDYLVAIESFPMLVKPLFEKYQHWHSKEMREFLSSWIAYHISAMKPAEIPKRELPSGYYSWNEYNNDVRRAYKN